MRELDDFIKLVQQRAMRDLWDNEFDDRYAWKFEITPEIKEVQERMAIIIQNVSLQIQARRRTHTFETMHTNFSMPVMRRVGNELQYEFIVTCDTCDKLLQ